MDKLIITKPEDFFKEQMEESLKKYKLKVSPLVPQYLSNLCIKFLIADNFFEENNNKKEQPTLAFLLKEAVEAEKQQQKEKYQKLGDVALFMAGFFPGYFSNKIIDIDYYIQMGSAAYLEVNNYSKTKLFQSLSYNFSNLVGVLSEIHELPLNNQKDILRAYEVWNITKNPKLYDRLVEKGIFPTSFNKNKN